MASGPFMAAIVPTTFSAVSGRDTGRRNNAMPARKLRRIGLVLSLFTEIRDRSPVIV